MRKTALQQLIDWSQNDLEIVVEDTDEALRIFKAIKGKATELLETEREQIEEAWNSGASETVKVRISGNKLSPECKFDNSKQYYKDTYE